jgi:hypothetical protein
VLTKTRTTEQSTQKISDTVFVLVVWKPVCRRSNDRRSEKILLGDLAKSSARQGQVKDVATVGDEIQYQLRAR